MRSGFSWLALVLSAAWLASSSLPAHEPHHPRSHWRNAREQRAARAERAYHYFLDGRALARRGYLEAAVEELEMACELVPGEARYQLLLGKVLRNAGEPKGAVMHLRWAYETGDDKARDEAARLLAELGAEIPAEIRDAPPSKLGKEDDATPSKSAKKESKSGTKTLYERLGGNAAIKAVVDEFVGRVGDDKRISSFFQTASLHDLKARLVEQIGQAAGGPEKYAGRSMKEVHKGMGVKDEHFSALVEDLVGALDKFKVPEKEKGELLGLLGPMKADIVE